MGKLIKKFSTESEFAQWSASTEAVTPWVCMTADDGKMHYSSGDENDYSVTIKYCGGGLQEIIHCSENQCNELGIYLNGKRIYPFAHTNEEIVDYRGNKWKTGSRHGILINKRFVRGGIPWETEKKHMLSSRRSVSSGGAVSRKPKTTARKRRSGGVFYDVKSGDIVKIIFPHNSIPHFYFSSMKADIDWIKIGDGIKTIGERAFYDTKCNEIRIGKGLETIGLVSFLPGNAHKYYSTGSITVNGTNNGITLQHKRKYRKSAYTAPIDENYTTFKSHGVELTDEFIDVDDA